MWEVNIWSPEFIEIHNLVTSAMIVDKYDGFHNLKIIESHVVANLKYRYTLHNEIFNALCIWLLHFKK